MQRSHVIFDFDGVLCDSLPHCIAEYKRLRELAFPSLPDVSVETRMDYVFAGPLKTALDEWLGPEGSGEFFDAHSAAMLAASDELTAFEGVEGLLDSLPPSSASIVSSAYNDAIHRVLADESGVLPSSIHRIFGRDTREPKTKKILRVLSTLNIDTNSAVYVGDMESDLLYCEEVPIDCILVSYGYHSREHLAARCREALRIIDSISELRSFLVSIVGENERLDSDG